MKAIELANFLLDNPNLEVMVLDGSNGQGSPRIINFGPLLHTITKDHADESGDCENIVGQKVIILGFGCY